MLDFSLVKEILLPDVQGDVVRMEDSLGNILWESGGGTDYSSKYFFIENKSNSSENWFSITAKGSGTPQVTFYVSPDEDYWMELGTTAYGTPLTFPMYNRNERVYIKAVANTFNGTGGNDFISINADYGFSVGGNIMSLLYGDNFLNQTSFPSGYTKTFRGLFNSAINLVSARNLVLPATTLVDSCYQIMFGDCSNLVTPPQLPATTLAGYCYRQMFQGCTSLTTAPTLPAPTLTNYCYYYMFYGCTSLVTAPALPATTLADYCYQSMFYGCTALTTTPSTLPAMTLKPSCYSSMFSGCTSLTTAPTLPATTLATYCYQYMFNNCTSLTTTPSTLPATTLASYCYSGMFQGCTSLETAPSTLPATTLASYCYSGMFQGCTSLETAPDLPAPLLVQNCYTNMFYGCSSLDYIKAMFVTTPGTSYTASWVNGVAASGTFVKNELATWTVSGNNGIPTSWSVETDTNTDDRASYFYFEDISGTSNQISLKKANTSAPTITVSYSTNLSSWYTLSNSSTTARTITLPANGKVYLKCTADRWCSDSNNNYYNNLTTTKNAIVGGNIMSLIYGDAFPDNISTKNTTSLSGALRDNTNLISAERLALPATTLTDSCYRSLFYGCSALTTPPSTLPATTLVSNCYRNMFNGCTSLTTAPLLPATTLVSNCYHYMFSGCSSLNHIEVGFTQWDDSATSNWVNGVPNKNDGLFPEEVSFVCPETLPEDYGVNRVPSPFWRMTRSENEYFYVENINGSAINVWFYRETQSATYTSTTRSVTAPAVTFEYSYDKSTWNTYTSSTSESNKISVPDGGRVYFRGNNSNLINCDFYKNSTNKCYFNLRASNLMRTDGYFNVGGNISSLVNSSATSFADGFTVPIGALFNSNTKLKHASRLNINAIGNDNGTAAYTSNPVIYSMFSGCTSLVTPPTLPSTTLNQIGARKTSNNITDFMEPEAAYYCMFRTCSALVYAPKLPATTLKNSCYKDMFAYCTSLTKAPVLPASTLVGSTWDYRDGTSSYTSATHGCYDMTFKGCSSLNYIKAMFTTTPNDNYTPQWVNGVAATGTFVKKNTATWNVTGVNGVPSGWTVQTASS